MAKDFQGRVALVTGASSGIGQQAAVGQMLVLDGGMTIGGFAMED